MSWQYYFLLFSSHTFCPLKIGPFFYFSRHCYLYFSIVCTHGYKEKNCIYSCTRHLPLILILGTIKVQFAFLKSLISQVANRSWHNICAVKSIESVLCSSGVLIILPASGNGTFHARFGDARALVKGKMSTKPRDGKTYLNVDNLDVELRVKDVQMRVRKIFNNNRILSKYRAIMSSFDEFLTPSLSL